MTRAAMPAPRIPVGVTFTPAATFAGAVDGFEFKTRDGVTGYYKSTPRIPPLAVELDRVLSTSGSTCEIPSTCSQKP